MQPVRDCRSTQLDMMILGVGVRILCSDRAACRLLRLGLSGLLSPTQTGEPTLEYRIDRIPSAPGRYTIVCDQEIVGVAADQHELLYTLEKHLTIALQLRCPEFLFLHAAAVERDGAAYLLIGPSGGGKSTLTWALLHYGFGYLTDELAPVELNAMRVAPYPHAICLKTRPPKPFELPSGTLFTSSTFHIPVESLPAPVVHRSMPIKKLFFVQYRPMVREPTSRKLTPGEASARAYASGLNLLAHSHFGLPATAAVAGAVDCYEFFTGDLRQSCRSLCSIIEF